MKNNIRNVSILALFLSFLVLPASLMAQRVVESGSHRFEEVAEGVWHVSGNGTIHTMSNAMVLVGEFDTLIVDSHVTPVAARALIDSLSVVTDKPVRYLVNCHYHFDHAQAFVKYMNAIPEVNPTPPNITLAEKMTLFQVVARGSREIQLLHFGRAHTGGDVVVYLPQERIAFTGDMMLPGLAYMGDGQVDEWPAALEGLKNLNFDAWLPGHGPVMRDKSQISNFQEYLLDLWVKAEGMHSRSAGWEEAAERLDMTNHSANFPQIQGPGVDPRAIRRIFELLDER